MISVLSGDIIQSESLKGKVSWTSALKDVSAELESRFEVIGSGGQIFQGDGFQIGIKNPEDSLLAAILIRAGLLKIDPDLVLGRGVPGDQAAREDPAGTAFLGELKGRGWYFSPDQIQFRNTVVVDLTESEEEILARMKSKNTKTKPRTENRTTNMKGTKIPWQ